MKNKKTVYVIGGANIDCVGFPLQPLNPKDSNPAIIKTSFGGVARNIVDNLSLYDERVKFLTVFSNDGFGKDMEKDLIQKGVDTSSSLHFDDPTPIYMAMLDQSQDLFMAMVDTRLLDAISEMDIVRFLAGVNEKDVVVLDTNLHPTIIETIITHAKGRVVCDPISIEKGKKVQPYLTKLSLFKPNQYQAEILSGIKIEDESSLIAVGQFFRKKNIKQTIITLGDKGGLLVDKHSMIRYRSNLDFVVNAVGAGDAFLAAFITFSARYDKIKALTMSVAAADMTCQSKETVNQAIDEASLQQYLDHYKIEIELINE